MSSNEDQQAMFEKQIRLNLQLDKMGLQAFGNRVHAPKKPLTKVDEDVIKEYNKQFKVVQFQTMIDENGNKVQVLDEEGRPIPITEKNQIPPPELEAYPQEEILLDEFGNPFDFELFKIIEDPITSRDFTMHLNELKLKINRLTAHREKLIDQLNYTPSSNRKRVEGLARLIDKTDEEINVLIKELEGLSELPKRIEQKKNEFIEIEQRNKNVKASIKSKNSRELEAYKESLDILNKGELKVEKKPEETEEEFLDRLKANAEIKTLDETLFEAREYTRRKFKENLKQLVRNESTIETVANELKSPNEKKEIEVKDEINKTFPRFKELFIELFGVNNKSITSGDIYEFIESYISNGEKTFISSFLEAKKDNKIKKEVIKAPEESIFTITNPKNNKSVNFLPIIDDNGIKDLLWSLSILRNTFKEVVGDTSLREIYEATGITITELKRQLGKNTPSDMATKLINKIGKKPITFGSVEKPFKKLDEETGVELYGWGIKPEIIPDAVPFGKLKLMLHKLYYKNMLVIKHRDGSNVIGLPNLRVSDEFVKIILKVIKGDKIKHSDLETLKTQELHLYNRIIHLAELHKTNPIDTDKTIKHLKHKMELLVGEIQSGNDSKEIKKELHQIVHSLKEFGVIGTGEAKAFIKQIKE